MTAPRSIYHQGRPDCQTCEGHGVRPVRIGGEGVGWPVVGPPCPECRPNDHRHWRRTGQIRHRDGTTVARREGDR